jgi:hypothetical protein
VSINLPSYRIVLRKSWVQTVFKNCCNHDGVLHSVWKFRAMRRIFGKLVCSVWRGGQCVALPGAPFRRPWQSLLCSNAFVFTGVTRSMPLVSDPWSRCSWPVLSSWNAERSWSDTGLSLTELLLSLLGGESASAAELYTQCYSPVSQEVHHLCGLVVRVPGYTTEMYCDSCEVRTEFIYAM